MQTETHLAVGECSIAVNDSQAKLRQPDRLVEIYRLLRAAGRRAKESEVRDEATS